MGPNPHIVAPGPRCPACGARLQKAGEPCMDCGTRVTPLPEIGVLNGVNQNFGTVNNVYNLVPPEPEVVDLRDIQDSLNERFPERILPPGSGTPAPRTGPGRVVRFLNTFSYLLLAIFVVWAGLAVLAILH
jgi:hypothetical protein